VEDIVLSDTARSIRQEAIDSLGSPPLARWRRREAEAKRAGLPRAAGLLAVGAVTLIFLRRLRAAQRWVIVSIAAVPAILFTVDGALAVSRIWKEPVEVHLAETTPRNRQLHRFQQAITQKNLTAAESTATDAIAAGASSGPLHLVLGHLHEELGQLPEAAREYGSAVSAPRPAPGGWAGLARIAFEQRNYPEAVGNWNRYLASTAPDPTSLVLKASALGHAGDAASAQDCLERAIAIDPARPEPYDLSSRIAAIQGDAATAISRLREEEKLRGIDRDVLARDPTFSLLADKAAWKAFLAEKPPPRRLPS
jgi:tetratricopeptide (TPR) repeat protein